MIGYGTILPDKKGKYKEESSMKNRILFASLVLSLILSAFVMVSGCGTVAGGGGGGGGGGLTAVQIYATTEASKASVFAKGDNVYVVFTTNNSRKLIYAKSTDEGVTFTVVTEEVVNVTDEGFCRMVVADDNTLYAAYRKYTTQNLAGISTIDAASGTHFTNLNMIGGGNIKINGLDMSVKTNDVIVAFNDIADTTPNYRIRITYPYEQATTVGTTTYYTRPYGGVVSNMVTLNTSEVVFVNNDESAITGEIICSRTDNGWSTNPTSVVTSSAAGIFDTMDMASTAEVLYVCFVINNKLYCVHSPDLGATWQPPVLVSDPAIGNTFSSLVCANGKIYIMFLKNNTTVCLGVSDDGGDTWAVSTLATIALATNYPEMFIDGTKAYLVYRTSEGIFLLKTTL